MTDRRRHTAHSLLEPLPIRLIGGAAKGLAVLGGLALVGAMGVTLASVTGRAAFDSPILGDYELVERLVGVAVFLFLPYGHWVGGHVTVDLVVRRLPDRLRASLARAVEVAFALVAAALAWRMTLGGLDMHRFNDSSMMLGIPTWWAFALIVPSLCLLSAVCVVRAVRA
ncbi:TRAP transporter small permease [Caenispirillum salinarum]|uniref:TRAP transporter small permease n=1 Tax=Caenispirillum salinarum TaxID=859058 RepID=UPI00384B821E